MMDCLEELVELGDGAAGTVAAAWLMTDFGFSLSGRAAAARVRILCPGLLA